MTQQTIRADHVAVSVRDLERAKAWFAAALGLRPVREFELPSGARIAQVRNDAGAGVELIAVDDPAEGLHDATPAEAMGRLGYGHVAFLVEDVDALVEELAAAGTRVASPPEDIANGTRRMAFVHDPDGNLVELVQQL